MIAVIVSAAMWCPNFLDILFSDLLFPFPQSYDELSKVMLITEMEPKQPFLQVSWHTGNVDLYIMTIAIVSTTQIQMYL